MAVAGTGASILACTINAAPGNALEPHHGVQWNLVVRAFPVELRRRPYSHPDIAEGLGELRNPPVLGQLLFGRRLMGGIPTDLKPVFNTTISLEKCCHWATYGDCRG